MKRFLRPANNKEKSIKPVPSAAPSPPPPPPPQSIVHNIGLQPKYVVPPIPHPNPHEHLAIVVTKNGLLLRPHHISGLVRPESYVKISWGLGGTVEERQGDGVDADPDADWTKSVVVYGIIGILDLFSASYLLVISSRTEVGNLFDNDHTIYGVKGITAIPLTEERARIAINTLSSRNSSGHRTSLIPAAAGEALTPDTLDTLSSREERLAAAPHVKFASRDDIQILTDAHPSREGTDQTDDDDFSVPSSSGRSTPVSDISDASHIEKTFANRLSFWTRLSKRTSNLETSNAIMAMDESSETISPECGEIKTPESIVEEKSEPAASSSTGKQVAPPPATQEERHSELENRIVKECLREFSRGGMYFTHNFDITRSLQHKRDLVLKSKRQNVLLAELNVSNNAYLDLEQEKVEPLTEPSPTLPLWRRVDRQFWWNEWMSKQFVDAGLHGYILPIMQGYIQIAIFNTPREPVRGESGNHVVVDYIIMSRRSRDRAGLRYQRRGVGEEGHVANFVETETIMRVEREGKQNIFSYVQIRGSIPLYWSQTGYGLKPAPQLSSENTHDQNMSVIRRHFQKTISRYGPHAVVNLAEQHGKEGEITHAYRDYVKELDSPDIQYCEYDFHAETRGMKYENISKLVNQLERIFESQGYLWTSDGNLMSEQKGVYRVNCIDCLDRTNVVQSAFARHVLNRQLSALALHAEEPRTESDLVLNDVWANNGDAISQEYAGTSALKGDYTRTGKRDIGGMLNDGMNSLARMYTSTFSDWFCQAVIDYMLGYRTISVFSEFLLKLQSTDPRELIRLSRIRAEAIATSVSRVLIEGERLLSGWTVFSPVDLNTKLGDKFEEKILLLTATGLYIISYDYALEKVKLYTRVLLGDIVQIVKGAYIISPLEEVSQDPAQNAGFKITWHSSKQHTRATSYTVRNSLDGLPAFSTSEPDWPHLKHKTTSAASSRLSNLLVANTPVPGRETTFAAFKVLPIERARTRRTTGSFIEPADEFAGARDCGEAVNIIVDAIVDACEAAGTPRRESFVVDGDVVSLAEAKRNTTMFAKMEYGVKRLLWLGG